MPPFKNIEERKYPYFGKSKFGIVLFTSPENGVCVKSGGNKGFMFGKFSNNWGEENFQKIDISEIHLIEEVVSTQTHKTNLKGN